MKKKSSILDPIALKSYLDLRETEPFRQTRIKPIPQELLKSCLKKTGSGKNKFIQVTYAQNGR